MCRKRLRPLLQPTNEDKMRERIELYSKTGLNIKDITNLIFNEFQVRLTYRSCYDLVHTTGNPSAARSEEMDGLVQYLDTQQQLGNLNLSIFTENKRLERVAWVTSEMQDRLLQWGGGEVVLIDTTYKKNRFQMPLAIMVVFDGEGETIIVSAPGLHTESGDAFFWWLNFIRGLGWEPKAVFSDGDLAMALAIESTGTRHFSYCTEFDQKRREVSR